MRRVAWRLVPILGLGYFCNLLDRANIAMAAPSMNADFKFSATVYGFGAGVLYLGYLVGEIPSNLLLSKIGARIWIARILISWGIASGLTAFIWNEWSFYGVRVLLGLAEAGFFPGVVLYMTWWFPSAYRTRILAMFYSSIVISLIIGPPIGTLLLHLDGVFGLRGWQWLFLVEMLPSIVMCVVIWFYLTDRPADAHWLTPEQRAWLSERLQAERQQRESIRRFTLVQSFCSPKILMLTLAYFCHNVSQQALVFFMPLIVKGLGVSPNLVGVVSGIPFAFALIAMNYWGRHSDKTGERTWHLAGGWLLCAAGMGACILIGGSHPVALMCALCFAAMGTWCAPVVFWSIPSAMLTGTAAAGGIAMINAIGNLGGWVGPWLFGVAKDATGSDNVALLCLASGSLVAAVAALAAGHDRRMENIPDRGF
ncbi:MFS transporter [Methylocapsa sp. S129]|uniref:MFS transporter n=1 Tax=Methylocapsa sp. S129 TaxID=1641869 RepID=UPI00131D86B0|nr:MFS transporter [Methylocapsa sp. S129]